MRLIINIKTQMKKSDMVQIPIIGVIVSDKKLGNRIIYKSKVEKKQVALFNDEEKEHEKKLLART